VVLLTNTWLLDWRLYGQIVNGVYGAIPQGVIDKPAQGTELTESGRD
jgi:hypothetical protein